jgi:chromosome segregation ATPase
VSDKNALKIERLETEKELLRIQFEKSRQITDSLERNTAALKEDIQKSKLTIAEQEKSLQALKKRSKTYQYVEKYTDTRLDSFFMARYPRTDVHFFDSASDRK